jgi:hypothetical protein
VLLIAALAAIAAFAVTAGWAQPAKTITVCSTGCDYSTIQAAIDHASSGDEISIHAGVYYEHVTVEKDLTLTGAHTRFELLTRISGHGRAGPGDGRPLVTIARGVDVRISGVMILSGYTRDGGGGGILNEGTLNLYNSVVIENHSNVHGGGVDNRDGASLSTHRVGIYDNTAVERGGGIYNAGSVSLGMDTIIGNNRPTNCAGPNPVRGCPIP